MKKISTLFFSSLFSLSLLAYDGSRLSVSSVSNKMDVSIEVDGRKFNMENNAITLKNLSEGNHSIRIYRDKARNGNGFGFGKRSEVIFASTVFLRRGFHYDITVNRFGKIFTDERSMDQNEDWDDDTYYDGGFNSGNFKLINAREFDNVKFQISKEFHESSRLVSATTIINANNFSTQQVKELMLLFTFENNKLDIAKTAYRNTVDKQNYYQLNEVLAFNSSKDELARFIRTSR